MDKEVISLTLGAIAAGASIVGALFGGFLLWRRRPNLELSVQEVKWFGPGAMPASNSPWLLGVKLYLDNASDRGNTIRSVTLTDDSGQALNLAPIRIVGIVQSGRDVVLDIPGGKQVSFQLHRINYENLLNLPLLLAPNGSETGWFMFNLSPKEGKPQFELVLKPAQGPDRKKTFQVD